MGKQKTAPISERPAIPCSQDMALRLLYIQQRIEALERLYNEEVSNLKKDVSNINVAFVRQAQAQGRLDTRRSLEQPPDAFEDDAEGDDDIS